MKNRFSVTAFSSTWATTMSPSCARLLLADDDEVAVHDVGIHHGVAADPEHVGGRALVLMMSGMEIVSLASW